MGSEMRMSVFFIKKSIFSKFLKLWGNISYCIRTGFEDLFQPLNDFEPTFTVFEKNRFFDEKNVHPHFWTHKLSLTKKRVFFIEKSIFFKDGEGRLKIIQRLKQDLKAGPNTIGYISSKFQELWKNRFFDEKIAHSHFWPHKPFLTKCAFFHQKINFFQRRWG